MQHTIVLAAGGTGGHLFPAYALTHALVARGHTVDLMTDERAEHYGVPFPGREVHIVPSATLASKSPTAMLNTAIKLSRGVAAARSRLNAIKPSVVMGFGGYPTFPPLVAARLLGIRTAVHEANAVLGRANRMLAKRLDLVAVTFEGTRHLEQVPAGNVVVTGMPVRRGVIEAAATPLAPVAPAGEFRLAVFGGSQGARFFSDLLPAALALLPDDARHRLSVTQQCRPEDLERVQAAYELQGVRATLSHFFTDLPQRLADAHLVVARSGASTVAELAVIGRASILVPLPHAVDNDQLLNARRMADAGAALCIEQADLTPERLARELGNILDDPDMLTLSGARAASLGRADAADRLADALETLIGLRAAA